VVGVGGGYTEEEEEEEGFGISVEEKGFFGI